MGYPATKMIIDGIAHSTVGKAVEAILAKTKNPEDVFTHFGEKTASLSSAISVAKKNLGIISEKKVKSDSPKTPKMPVMKAVSEDGDGTMFCPHCGKENKFQIIGIAYAQDSVEVSSTIAIRCTCGKHSQIKV